ncbi:DUF4124 domain-containing protein [Parashewanella curva]|uniref:DUF4124 domain-containing protein n=1 Tax=Parashewanella curva TaxID=2338552 RepID=A0A3L8Q1P6_9GAMM|nr:DUF4124 domain-containing protein [Parashewanella curva]RLV60232.1 DUF4124 domain-containing protein [Parashewanella curva]
MARFVVTLLMLLLCPLAHTNSFLKCTLGEKVVYTQTTCPNGYKRQQINYQSGIINEIDLDKESSKEDPLKVLLKKGTVSRGKLLKLIRSEIIRLKREISFNKVVKNGELQEIERNRYWQDIPANNPKYLEKIKQIHQHFDSLNAINQAKIKALSKHYLQIDEDAKG